MTTYILLGLCICYVLLYYFIYKKKTHCNILKERESGGIYETDIMLWRF